MKLITSWLCSILLFSLLQYNNIVYALEVGDTAPEFSANNDQGDLWRSGEYVGKGYLVVYFYPAAMTGGCTKQACSFRDGKTDLNEEGIEVVGISSDPVNNLKIFKQAHNLNFTLLSDVNGEIAKMFGVPLHEGGSITRTVEGKEILMLRSSSPERWTYIIDKSGKVAYKNTEVEAENDSKEVLTFIKKLKK